MTLLVASLAAAVAHDYQTWTVGPSPEWCAVFSEIAEGDLVELLPGDYAGECAVIIGGIAEENEALLVRSLDLADPAIIHVAPAGFGLVVAAPSVRLYGLRFEGTGDGVGVLGLADGLVVQAGAMADLRSGVDASVGPKLGASVLDATFDRVTRPIRLTAALPEVDTVVRGSVIHGWDGLAIDVLGVTAKVFDNVVGPGAGTAIAAGPGEVITNVVLGGDVGIDAAGASVRRNAVAGTILGIRVGAGAVAVGNTVVHGGIARDGGSASGNVVVGEADPSDTTCGASCFVDLAGLDLTPAPGGPLVGAGDPASGPDLCDRESEAPALGATDGPGPVGLEALPLAELCMRTEAPVEEAREEPVSLAPRGCGRSGGVAAGALLFVRRRRAQKV